MPQQGAASPPAASALPDFIAVGGLGCLLAAPSLLRLASAWDLDPNYSHGWLVPPLGLYLLVRALRQTPRTGGRQALGVGETLAGGLLHLAALVVPWPLLDFAGCFLIIRGLLLATGGSAWAQAGTVPSLFLLFMFPLPVSWTGAAAVWLQGQVCGVSGALLGLLWVCLRQGNSLLLAGVEGPLVVAEACSGLRQIVAFAGLAVLLGSLLRRPGWQVGLLALLSIPCAILANVARVLAMAAGARLFGSEWLHGWMHDLPVLFTLPLGLLLFITATRLLPNTAPAANPSAEPAAPLRVPRPALAALAVLALAQFSLLFHLEARPVARPGRLTAPLAAFPESLRTADGSTWHGRTNDLQPDLARQLAYADEFIHRRYSEPKGQCWVNLYVVHSARGTDREHHPEVCVRDVGGASENTAARALLMLGDGVAAQRFRFRTKAQPELTVYYWHATLPPSSPPGAESTFLQRLHARLRQRPASVTVQVTTPLPPASLKPVEAELVPAMQRELRRLLPPNAKFGHDRLPIRLAFGE